MDFLSRLIGGSGVRGSKAAANQPQQRLGKFKKSYNQALTQCHKLNNAAEADPVLLDLVQTHFQRLTSLLEDDTRAPAPHLCLNFASSSFVYTAISRIAFSLKHDPITREAVSFFAILIDSDEENLLATERFAEALMTFVDAILGFDAYLGGSNTQSEALELIFSIAAKVRLEPELLPVWFRKKADTDSTDEKQEALTDSSQQDDFPLVHQLVGHVYAEGRAGDFARTGLLYILESASDSQVLEHWIAFSELPTLMASGLGGLYSQLSRKLSIARPKDDLPLILALSDSRDHPVSSEADSLFAEELQARLGTFMSYLVFWQDVLEHCHSLEIKETLVDRFQVEFLEQILYPSLLQSSDLDGGSSVAVLTYLCRILDSVDHPDIIHLILHYLLALPGPVSSRPVTPRSPDAQRQKKSLKEHESPDATEEVMNPSFFNLTDLLLASCQSRNPETVTAALRLVCVILSKYHDYALSSLLKMVMFEDSFTSRPPGLVLGELDTLLAIAADSAGMEGLNEAYENSIRDSLALLEAHPCSADLFGISELRGGMIASKGAIMDDKHPTMCMHSLSAEDPLLKQLVTLLRTFFTNDIETNLSLTSAIRYLALCPFVRLSGWLCTETTISSQLSEPEPSTAPSSDPESRTQDNLDPDAQELTRIREYKASLRQSSTDVSTTPLIQALHHLTHTLVALRHDIPEFAHLLAGRKRAFQGLAELEDEALNQRRTAPTSAQPVMASPRASVEQSREQSRSRPLPIPTLSPSPSGQAAAAQQRSISPRGRTMSILAGQGSPRSLGSTSSPRQLQSPVSFGSPPSFGARPSFRPQLREEMQRRQSRSPVKVSRAMSPLAAVDGASMGSPRSGRSISPTESPPVQQLEQAGSMDQEIFDRWIRFSWEGEYDAERNKGRRTDVSADEHNRGKSGGDKGDTDGDTGDYREASLTHVLTNAVILQEFVLELAAIIHVRAGLLNGEMSSEGNTA